jgi:anti-sigma B factor antagonist
METSMRLEIVDEREGTVPVLRLLGTLDVSTVDQLRQRIITLLEQEAPAVALDMAQVAFVDSSGLGALLGGKKRALEKGVGYYLLDCPPPLQRLIGLVGLDQVMDFCTRRELTERFPALAAPLVARPVVSHKK